MFWLVLLWMMLPARAVSNEPITLVLTSNHIVTPSTIALSYGDLAWLAQKHTLTVAVYGLESPPLSINSATGRYRGMNADYLALLGKALNTNVIVKLYVDESQALAALQAGSVDLVLSAQSGVSQLEAPFITSLPLVRGYPTLVTRQAEVMKPFHDISGNIKVAITQGFPSESFIKQSFPNASIVSFAHENQALASVAAQQSDYFFGNNLTTSFIIARDYYQTLDMVKFWREPQSGNVFIALANQRQLVNIVDSFIRSLTEPLHSQIVQSWIDMGNLAFLSKRLTFTTQETRWLQKHPKLRVLVNPYYAPFSMVDENQEMRGLVGDILNLIQLQTGLTFEPVIANSNEQMVGIMRKGDWDILPSATYSPDREEQIAFTHPYLATPFVMVTRVAAKQGIELQPGMKVAIPAYHTLLEKLKIKYPGVKWIEVENTSAALSMLDQGEIDAVVSTQLAARYIIDHYYPDRMTYTRIPDERTAQISFAVPRSSPELQSIMNKALDDIPPKELLNLAGKWVKTPEVKIDTWNLYNRPFYLVIILATLLVVSSLLWGAYLLRAIRKSKKAQAALEYQLGFRQTLFNSIPVPVYVISLQGEVESYNSAFGDFFSPELYAAMHYSLFDRRHPLADIFAAVQPVIQQGLQANQVIPHQLVLNNGTEERLILHWLTLCQLPANTTATLICGWQDITESRQLMQALQVEKDKAIDANRAKSTFLASMSHEIRTPVSAIMGFLELLTTHSQSPAEEKESIQLAYATAQSLLGLIGDVLDMEKIESGNFELTPEWVDLASLLATTVSSFEGVATLKNLRLSVDYHLGTTQALWLDPQAVKQILANLLSNAIKFTVEGGVEVIAQTHSQGTDQTRLTLSVKDSGAGIGPQEQQHLFKPFSQTEGGKQQTGSGLGLTICRELVERMAGSIEMASQPGRGTTMTVTLITAVADLDKVTAVSFTPKAPVSGSKALRIVIADDHPTNRLLLRRQLDTLGYRVDEAIDGVEALAMIEANPYDLLITDLNMPNMDGMTLTCRVREFNQEIIIWGLTANAQAEEKERCLAMGMNLCLFKPVDLPQLEAALQGVAAPSPAVSLSEFVDMATLQALSLGDNALMRQMLEQARQENDKDLLVARQAHQLQDWPTLQRHLHRINGTAQLLGATSLHQLSEALENALAKQQHEAIIEQGMRDLEQLLLGLNAAIEAFSHP
ncbi:MAG: transporter substrate-binding domain-containing protein [Serratia sp. (in: enterobacteria)]|uniref:transporter substrate-binding domain-containing protein n=1 Tax=Serratia sp. (in: enterobacteria) TaxID=616 RepID=UPI003F30D398